MFCCVNKNYNQKLTLSAFGGSVAWAIVCWGPGRCPLYGVRRRPRFKCTSTVIEAGLLFLSGRISPRRLNETGLYTRPASITKYGSTLYIGMTMV